MYDQPIIVADPTHLSIHMMVVRMRAGRHVESTKELETRREALVEGLQAWCAANLVTLEWSSSSGRRTSGREYRIAYAGDNMEADNPKALYDALDAEMVRLMLE
jgi:hypothetical protein